MAFHTVHMSNFSWPFRSRVEVVERLWADGSKDEMYGVSYIITDRLDKEVVRVRSRTPMGTEAGVRFYLKKLKEADERLLREVSNLKGVGEIYLAEEYVKGETEDKDSFKFNWVIKGFNPPPDAPLKALAVNNVTDRFVSDLTTWQDNFITRDPSDEAPAWKALEA